MHRVVFCCHKAESCYRAVSCWDGAVSQCHNAVSCCDTVVSQCDRAVSLGRDGRNFRDFRGVFFNVNLCILTL